MAIFTTIIFDGKDLDTLLIQSFTADCVPWSMIKQGELGTTIWKAGGEDVEFVSDQHRIIKYASWKLEPHTSDFNMTRSAPFNKTINPHYVHISSNSNSREDGCK